MSSRRSLGALAAGLAGSLAAWRWLPLPADDPLRGTLCALPLVVAVFAALGDLGWRAGGRRLSPAAGWSQLAAAAGLFVLGVAGPHLGIGLPAEAVVCALVLLLALRVAAQVVALRPLLGRRLPLKPSGLFFLLPLAVYAALLPWTSERRAPDGDEPYYLLIAHSLVHDFDTDLSDEYRDGDWRGFLDRPLEPQPGDPVGADGQKYSRHNAALPVLLVPGYWLAGLAGALLTMALLTAALAWATLRLAARYVPERPGAMLAAWSLLAFGPPLLLYSGQVWVEVPAALVGVLVLDRIRARRDLGHGGMSLGGWVVLVLLVGLLPLLKIRFLILAGSLLALAWWHSGRRLRPLLVLGGALAATAAATLVYNQAAYGNPLKVHGWRELWPGRYPLGEYLAGFSGLFFDSAFGLFACAPLWLLLIPAAVWAARAQTAGVPAAPGLLPAPRRGSPVLLDLLVVAVPYLVLVAPRSEWYGGWSPPFRYPLVILPLLTVFLVPLLAGRRGGGARALTAALGVATVALGLLWIAVPGWTYSFADGRGHLLDLASASLGTDAARWFPSSIRPRLATWVWPLVAAVLLPCLWAWPRRLRSARAWGVSALLVLLAGGMSLAETRPTRVAELEDPWVARGGGVVYPDPWVTERRRFRGGWTLRDGESLTVPVVAGGEGVRIDLAAQFVRNRRVPLDLEVRAGERLLAVWRGRADRQWTELSFGPYAWPEDVPLVLAVRDPGRRDERPNGVILDRVDLQWY